MIFVIFVLTAELFSILDSFTLGPPKLYFSGTIWSKTIGFPQSRIGIVVLLDHRLMCELCKSYSYDPVFPCLPSGCASESYDL